MKIKFSKIPVGCRFFDNYSGEFWTKSTKDEGVMETGGFCGRADYFDADEFVEITVSNSISSIAGDFYMWCEYVDVNDTMTKDEFDSMSLDDRIMMIYSIWPESSMM